MLRRALALSAVGLGAYGAYSLSAEVQFYCADSLVPVLRIMDPETAHNAGIFAAKWGLLPYESRPDPPVLKTRVWGREFSNPIGLAAGFDKQAEVIRPMLGLGFGFVEIGSVTPQPQPGNPQPRVFRIPEQQATINRYGFNSLGADAADDNLQAYYNELARVGGDGSARGIRQPRGVLGVNLGKNKTSKDAAADYSIGLIKLARHADYVVINVSSPNTPGLRSLQGRRELEVLVKEVKKTRDRMPWGPRGPPPLLVKIAPDLTEADKKDIAAVVISQGVDGLVISNTTITRPGEVAKSATASEAGGLSGRPLFHLSTQVLSDMYRLTRGQVPIIGCGGVSSGEDAYRKIRAGASLVQLYTSLVYQGAGVLPRIKEELAVCLKRDGFESVAEAVGADHRQKPSTRKKGWFS